MAESLSGPSQVLPVYLAVGVVRSTETADITGFRLVQIHWRGERIRRVGAPVWFSLPSVEHLLQTGRKVFLPSRRPAQPLGAELRLDAEGDIVETDRSGGAGLLSDLPNL